MTAQHHRPGKDSEAPYTEQPYVGQQLYAAQPATGNDPGQQPRRRRRGLYPTLVITAVALTAVIATACSGKSPTPAPSSSQASTSPATVLPASVPDRIVIPSIGVNAKLNTVGLQSDGQMEAPDFAKPMDAAWYRMGPTPGEAGPAAIVGHLDTPEVPKAVFYKVPDLKKGAEIDVKREDHTTAVFTVDEVETFQKNTFPTQKVYGDTGGKAELRVITCGGSLTPDRHWDSNVVVFAHLTGKA
ncbi:class F sortase [Streptomyces sp. WAC06614]|uniref:class F sortase n=1 Tax=Streptomyces sp. WAC06614 TaxID=2487416 RepID=UPI000F7676DD|nr:class F sortase [Streptomyces sp. WAC06614]RSS64089.1 class F sortase [Streptomyces sp. WAC06614]